MTSQVHEFLHYRVNLILDELALETGIEVPHNNSNVSRCVGVIEEFLGLDQFNALEAAEAEFVYE